MKITHINEEQLAIREEMDRFMQKHRPAPEIRKELDISYRIEGRSIIIFEIRPHFLAREEKIENPIAKATFVKKSKAWKVYWMRSNGKWTRYGPDPMVDSIQAFTTVVQEDAYACFWG